MEMEPFAVVQIKDDSRTDQTHGGAGEESPQICRPLCFCLSNWINRHSLERKELRVKVMCRNEKYRLCHTLF